jgi:hypothetical protein
MRGFAIATHFSDHDVKEAKSIRARKLSVGRTYVPDPPANPRRRALGGFCNINRSEFDSRATGTPYVRCRATEVRRY